MPRRQLLRTLAATIAAGALDALRPRSASAAAGSAQGCGGGCGPVNTACCVKVKLGYHYGGCYRPGEECCTGPNSDGTNPMSWCCIKGACGQSGTCIKKCPPDRTTCGSNCCPPGWFCGSPKTSICCMNGQKGCFDGQGFGTCCQPPQSCKDGKCCDKCDADCCDATQMCCQGMMGATNRVCCKKNSDICMGAGSIAAGFTNICCTKPSRPARLLTRAIGGWTQSSPIVCCPPPRQVWNPGDKEPMACCDPSQLALPPGKMIIDAGSRGIQGMCCDTICGTGANLTCCPTGTSCVGGRCVGRD